MYVSLSLSLQTSLARAHYLGVSLSLYTHSRTHARTFTHTHTGAHMRTSPCLSLARSVSHAQIQNSV